MRGPTGLEAGKITAGPKRTEVQNLGRRFSKGGRSRENED